MTHRYWMLGLLIMLAVGFTAGPAAATDQDTFNKVIAKVAPSLGLGLPFKPRVACGCPDTSGNQIAGVLTQSGGVVSCLLPGFTATGALVSESFCENYVVLGY
jgi:hypothetical protein